MADEKTSIDVTVLILKLRQHTYCSFLDCRKAAIESEYNFDKAVEILRQRYSNGRFTGNFSEPAIG